MLMPLEHIDMLMLICLRKTYARGVHGSKCGESSTRTVLQYKKAVRLPICSLTFQLREEQDAPAQSSVPEALPVSKGCQDVMESVKRDGCVLAEVDVQQECSMLAKHRQLEIVTGAETELAGRFDAGVATRFEAGVAIPSEAGVDVLIKHRLQLIKSWCSWYAVSRIVM